MDFVINLETTKDYDPSKVVALIKESLDFGLKSHRHVSIGVDKTIIRELLNNRPTIERV